METVSVIVPVYNAEKYLCECVDSILTNTYTNIELILVDDGSTDASAGICDEYARKDSRVKVLHQKNSGVVAARNAALAVASGTYIGFVDADDAVSPVFYEQMVSAMERHEADIVTCEFHTDKMKLAQECVDKYYSFESLEDQTAVIVTAPWMRKYTWTSVSASNKLYRKSRNIPEFPKGVHISEDCKFNWDYIQYSRKMVVIPSVLYFYRMHSNSAMDTFRRKRGSLESSIYPAVLAQEIADAFPPEASDLNRFLDARAAYLTHSAMWRIYLDGKQRDYCVFVRDGKKRIQESHAEIRADKSSYPLYIRLITALCAYCFPLWHTVVWVYGLHLRKKQGRKS